MTTPLRSLMGATLRCSSVNAQWSRTTFASSSKATFSTSARNTSRTSTIDLPPHLRDAPASSSAGRSDNRGPLSFIKSETDESPALSPGLSSFLSTPSYTADEQRPGSTYTPHSGSSLFTRPNNNPQRTIPYEELEKGDRDRIPLRYLPIEPLVLPLHPLNPPKVTTSGLIYHPDDFLKGTMDAPQRHSRVTHILHAKCSRNNVHLSLCDQKGVMRSIGVITAGTGGQFKKGKRGTYEAAYQASLKAFNKVVQYARRNAVQVCVAYNGILGHGRDAVAAAMASPEGGDFAKLVVRVEDRTPVLMGGPRPRGKRSV